MAAKHNNLPKPVNVQSDKVGETVQSFIDNDGVTQMNVSQQPDGTFTITPER
jgi:hypothetical protein